MTTTQDPAPGTFRARLAAFLEQSWVRNGILTVIIFNAITLGMSTSERISAHIGPFLGWVDDVVLWIFVVEIALKLIAYRGKFFRDPFNVFDLIIVAVSFTPSSQGLSALRGLRVLRAMRLISAIPQMNKVVTALIDALPGMGAVIVMLSLVYYVFSVMATMMFGDLFDEWFGTIGRSAYSLFQIMTLESWSMGIVRPVMKEFPQAWAFFVPFIIITAFSILNLFIGLLVTTMQTAVEQENEEEFHKLRDLVRSETDMVDAYVKELHAEIKALREEIRALKGDE